MDSGGHIAVKRIWDRLHPHCVLIVSLSMAFSFWGQHLRKLKLKTHEGRQLSRGGKRQDLLKSLKIIKKVLTSAKGEM